MRVIKFRAWCTNQKIWLHQEEENTTVKEILDLFKSLNHEESCYKDTVILEQFTGLKDKNGVDIYEGDIIQNEAMRIDGIFWVVESDRGCFGAKGLALRAMMGMEVIGNIHNKTK